MFHGEEKQSRREGFLLGQTLGILLCLLHVFVWVHQVCVEAVVTYLFRRREKEGLLSPKGSRTSPVACPTWRDTVA